MLGGVPSVEKGSVTVIGGGVVGTNAAKMAVGLGAKVTVLDINIDRLEYLDDMFLGRVNTLYANRAHLESSLAESDLVVGAVLIHGARAPHLVTRKDLSLMKKGSVIVDVAIDQGGCIETARPTTHDDPVYVVDDVVHYCVTNMPGGVSRTATQALTTVTLNFGLYLADHGVEEAARINPAVARGINVLDGALTYKAVADAVELEYTSLGDLVPGAGERRA